MAGAKEHYERLLARHYPWMCGGEAAKLAENRAFFAARGIRPAGSALAVDLGAGCGFQSIPLAEAGFRVVAVDFSRQLLAKLREMAGTLPIEAVEADILEFAHRLPEGAELVVCMGDTLTHLPSAAAVERLLAQAAAALEPGGRLLLGFRDLTAELEGLDRFLPVRSDEQRIFTCFLEYLPEHVMVHDIVYERRADGGWRMEKSAFAKLRLDPERVRARLSAAGLAIEAFENENRAITLIARKPGKGGV